MLNFQQKNLNEGNHVAMSKCYFCGKSNNILFSTKLGDISKLHNKVVDMTPCNECSDYMSKGVIFIGVDSNKSDKDWNVPSKYMSEEERKSWLPSPYRSGEFSVVTDDGVKRMFAEAFNGENGEAMMNWALKNRFMFIEGEAMRKLGMVKDEDSNSKKEDNNG